MSEIKITITNKIATVQGTPIIVCGNSDYSVLFVFDEEWAGYDTKTARFVFNKNGEVKHIDQIFTGNTVTVPVLSGIAQVMVGVFAGNLRTTTPAKIYCERSILCGDGAPETPPDDIYNQLLEALNKGGVIATSTGDEIEVTDSADAPLRGLKLYGKTTQTAYPSQDNPIYPESAGDGGTINVAINGRTHAIPTPNGLPGIPDDTDGNYTDANGQKWYCDEIDFARGVYVQRVQKKVFDGTEETISADSMDGYSYHIPDIMTQDEDETAKIICSHFMPMSHADVDTEATGISVHVDHDGKPGICLDANAADVSNAFLSAQYAAGTPVVVWYRLAEPIETPLDDAQLAVFGEMRSSRPVTTVTNDENAGMAVEYATDIGTYIDNKIAQMPSEAWTFTLTDGSAVTKEVVVK